MCLTTKTTPEYQVNFVFKRCAPIFGNGTSQSLGDVHFWLERPNGTIITDTLTKEDEYFLKYCARVNDCQPNTLYYAEFDSATAKTYYEHWWENHERNIYALQKRGLDYFECVGYRPKRCFLTVLCISITTQMRRQPSRLVVLGFIRIGMGTIGSTVRILSDILWYRVIFVILTDIGIYYIKK